VRFKFALQFCPQPGKNFGASRDQPDLSLTANKSCSVVLAKNLVFYWERKVESRMIKSRTLPQRTDLGVARDVPIPFPAGNIL